MTDDLEDLDIVRLLHIIPDAVVIGDAATRRIEHVNAAFETMFGYTRDEAEGSLIEILVPPSLRDAHRRGIARYADGHGGELVNAQTVVELEAVAQNGHSMWVELRLSPLSASDEKPHVLAVIRDVTERRELRARIETAAADTESRSESLRQFVSMAAHDLRAPIGLIGSFLDLIASDPGLSERSAEVITKIHDLAARAYKLSDDMLGSLLLEAGADLPQPRAVLVADVTRAADDTADLAIDIPDGLVAWVDPGHAARMLNNLFSNARKYGAPPIEVSATNHNGEVELIVRDHGSGVPPDIAGVVFEPFVRGTSDRSVSGAGLGLAAVRKLAQLNGGAVTYTAVNPGAMFTLRLPAHPGDAAAVATD